MKHQTSAALHAYWQRRRGKAGVLVNQIRAAELAPLLTSLFLVDLDLAAGLRFRYCGAAVATRYGRDLTDEAFLALWDAQDRTSVERCVTVITARGGGLVAGVMGETAGGGFTSFEMLLLPLAGHKGAAGAIGSMVRVGGHEEMNRIRARLVAQSLRSVRFLPPAKRGEESSRSASHMLPEVVRSDARRRYGHLTVLPGGR